MFTQSTFFPIAIGFFGLGIGYFTWGGSTVFGYPKPTPEANKTLGLWGVWMPGFMQFITGVYLMVGMTWFGVFTKAAPLYMAALAFTAYGVHWFVMGHRRYIGSDPAPDAWMALGYLILSVLGIVSFYIAGDIPVAILFLGLTLIYLFEAPSRFLKSAFFGWLVGLSQVLTGLWLMYLTIATVLNFANGMHLWL